MDTEDIDLLELSIEELTASIDELHNADNDLYIVYQMTNYVKDNLHQDEDVIRASIPFQHLDKYNDICKYLNDHNSYSMEGLADLLKRVWEGIIKIVKKIHELFKKIINKIVSMFRSSDDEADVIIKQLTTINRSQEELALEAANMEVIEKARKTIIEVTPIDIDQESKRLRDIISVMYESSKEVEHSLKFIQSDDDNRQLEDTFFVDLADKLNKDIRTLGYGHQYRAEVNNKTVVIKYVPSNIHTDTKVSMSLYEYFEGGNIINNVISRMNKIKSLSGSSDELKNMMGMVDKKLYEFVKFMQDMQLENPTHQNAITLSTNIKTKINLLKMLSMKKLNTISKVITTDFRYARMIINMHNKNGQVA